MNSSVFSQWEDFTKSALESSKQLEAVNLKLAEKVLQKQLALAASALEAGNRVVSLLGEGKPLPEIFAAQTKLLSEYGNKVVEITRETTEIVSTAGQDYRSWLEQSAKNFSAYARALAAAVVPSAMRKAA